MASQVWLIASGKGGVGKSTLTACLAVALGRAGKRVCAVDADIGLRDLDAILGVENSVVYDLLDVTRGGCALAQALIPLPGQEGVQLLAASQFARARELDPKKLRRVLERLRQSFDFILLDAPAGMEKGLRTLLAARPEEILLVGTPDDTCMRDLGRVAMFLREKELPAPKLVVNRLRPAWILAGDMPGARTAAESLELPLLGEIPEDETFQRALIRRENPMDTAGEAAAAVTRIARRMAGEEVPLPDYGARPEKWYRRLFRRGRP